MTSFTINHTSTSTNAGIAREHDLCHYFGIERTKHDSSDYKSNSDICLGERHISVKASSFSLMSGSLCGGYDEFEDIWTLYKNNTHSNEFAYITEDYTVYMMNLVEFEQFVHLFCRVERESSKNGGKAKIKMRKETRKTLAWLEQAVA